MKGGSIHLTGLECEVFSLLLDFLLESFLIVDELTKGSPVVTLMVVNFWLKGAAVKLFVFLFVELFLDLSILFVFVFSISLLEVLNIQLFLLNTLKIWIYAYFVF